MAEPPIADPVETSRIQEFVVVVSNLQLTLPAFTDVLKWEVKHEGTADPSIARLWNLAPHTSIREVLVGNNASEYGFVRLMEIEGVEQQLIRPGAGWWDTGGTRNINVLVRDAFEVEAGLRRLGWTARSQPSRYERPGGIEGVANSMYGPDDLVISYQGRIGNSPPLADLPTAETATHVQNGYQITSDPEAWIEFFSDVVGFRTRIRLVRSPDAVEIGPNAFGLPHNTSGLNDLAMGGAEPKPGRQFLGVIHFLKARGHDFSDRARPPNIGIAAIRFPFAGLEALEERSANAGISPAVPRQTVEMAPYGRVSVLALRVPGGSGQWIEFFESAGRIPSD